MIQPDQVSQDLIDFSDILATLADVGGGQVPVDRPIDGRSFLPQLMGRTGTPRDWVYCWYERNGQRDKDVKRYARNRTYKLYRSGLFYNVPADELEKNPMDEDGLDAQTTQIRDSLKAVIDSIYAEEEAFPYGQTPEE
jgi:arylsulfatase A